MSNSGDKVQVGEKIEWDGLPEGETAVTPFLHKVAPPADPSASPPKPDLSRYPNVVGTSRLAITDSPINIRKRSWMGWFLWGDGVPPSDEAWDFYSWQYEAKTPIDGGKWTPIRLDQQPLYLNPFRLNYNWPPGKFGYKTQPLKDYKDNVGYWAEKRIVRGVNLSFAYPYLAEYADKRPQNPEAWQRSWLYVRTRPLETVVVVPSNKTPTELLKAGDWNKPSADADIFPYPVWDEKLSMQDQTPFCIKVDRMGDWDADLVWEGTNPSAKNYADIKYQRTPFSAAGKGNYLKITVGQGSPYIWCETNNNRYVILYNLIRTNEIGHIADAGGSKPTGAGTISGARDVPGVDGVQYVLLHGNQNNPNQFYQEVQPFKWDPATGKPGGWNPPGAQSAHTFVAIYFRKETVVTPTLGNAGKDEQGNEYFYLEFKEFKSKKNWFVIGAIPIMYYYHPDVKEDDLPSLLKAARKWAEELGKYAFNFLADTKINFDVKNMYKVTTKHSTVLQNPFVAAGVAGADKMVADPKKTVIALMPHHYQPITLGPSSLGGGDAKWSPLRPVSEFPNLSRELPNANKTDPTSPSRWGYWSPRGNHKAIVAGEFETVHLFQNFLPITPPANWGRHYELSGIQAVRITDAGKDYKRLPTDVADPKPEDRPKAMIESKKGSGAELLVLLEPYTDRIQQIDVVRSGEGYPDGDPPPTADISVKIDQPKIEGGRQATARVQVGGGKVLAVFMTDNGAGYRSSIQATPPASGAEPDPPIIPLFGDGGAPQLENGLVKVITGGAGWVAPDKAPPSLIVRGTGQGAKAEVVGPGQILRIGDSGVGGFTNVGTYPSTGDLEKDRKRIKVHVSPLKASVTKVRASGRYFRTLLVDPGKGYVKPTAYVTLEDGKTKIEFMNLDLDSEGGFMHPAPRTGDFAISKPFEVTFESQNTPVRKAKAWVLPGFSIETVGLEAASGSVYENDLEVAFSGGDLRGEDLAGPVQNHMPEFDFVFKDGKLESVSVKKKTEKPFYHGAPFAIDGGKGFNAALQPVCAKGADGKFRLLAVKIIRSGSNYPTAVRAYTDPGNKEMNVTVSPGDNRGILQVSLKADTDYTFTTIPAIFLTAGSGALDWVNNPAKGKIAKFTFNGDKNGGIKIDEAGENYLPNTANAATAQSLPAVARYSGPAGDEVASADQARGFIAEVVKSKVSVERVLYDSIISEFTQMSSDNLKPFGGKFGGNTAPDGYGLGNALSSATKVLGVLYNLHQHHSKDNRDAPSIVPSKFIIETAVSGNPNYIGNNPLITLKGGLKTMTQALQRTITLFFQETPYTNNPGQADWKMAYFSMYDKAGRVVVNPTATIPVYGVVSSVKDPPDIPDAQNKGKTGLKAWKKGQLWSGFGVSDQWNDQHYFYGYYLSAAGILAVLDGSWESDKRPAKLWADKDRIGTAVDQWMKTLAYDPKLDDAYYNFGDISKAGIKYEKYSYFDQWNGFSWATGVSPGRAGDVEPKVPWSQWSALGTGNAPYDDENENSTWEGLQAFSAMILWGAGTSRKSVVDQGIYILTTGQAASDLYFLDKNYNLKCGEQNQYSWCPVTTADVAGSGLSAKSGNRYDKGTGYVESNPKAFYGEASAGCSILHKGSPSLNNFFYAYPTGSKFIQAFPPTPWTMGMSRNLGYMRKWAEAMGQPEWRKARDSALFQSGNWLGMAMSSALCGFPSNPGDDPAKVRPYAERLWASWIVGGAAPGSQATMQPADTATSVLNFMHTVDEYGPPDWSIYAKAVDASGKEVDDQIVFTAAFSKANAGSVVTTFVAFNPTWKTCYVHFFRIGADGALFDAPIHQSPIRVDPKKMTLQKMTVQRPLGRVALITENPDDAKALGELLAKSGGQSTILAVTELSKLSGINPDIVVFAYSLVVGKPAWWGDLKYLKNYKVVGMDYGSLQLFRDWGLEISAGNDGQFRPDQPLQVELAELLNRPNIITPNKPSGVQVVKNYAGYNAFGIYDFDHAAAPRKFERIARFENHPNYWAIARQGNYLFWGFEASLDQTTPEGQRLLINVLFNHKLHRPL